MRTIILKCPSCDGNLTVTRLHCPSCSITIDGEFTTPALLKLSPAQIDFVEVFVKNRGVIREVERELGVSYPTVRARLDEVIGALGFQVRNEPSPEAAPADDSAVRRRAVLADLRAGKITADQALAALAGGRKD
ncbi:MAG TPA: DUF2089 domain-containing protein [Candidatus Binataceae bacterium]|nr:DUF2089 domain-containing protein [Candidatus Binataceae bacterium]